MACDSVHLASLVPRLLPMPLFGIITRRSEGKSSRTFYDFTFSATDSINLHVYTCICMSNLGSSWIVDILNFNTCINNVCNCFDLLYICSHATLNKKRGGACFKKCSSPHLIWNFSSRFTSCLPATLILALLSLLGALLWLPPRPSVVPRNAATANR